MKRKKYIWFWGERSSERQEAIGVLLNFRWPFQLSPTSASPRIWKRCFLKSRVREQKERESIFVCVPRCLFFNSIQLCCVAAHHNKHIRRRFLFFFPDARAGLGAAFHQLATIRRIGRRHGRQIQALGVRGDGGLNLTPIKNAVTGKKTSKPAGPN